MKTRKEKLKNYDQKKSKKNSKFKMKKNFFIANINNYTKYKSILLLKKKFNFEFPERKKN